MKKFISMVMAAAMVVSLVPATAFAKVGDVTATAKVVNGWEKTKDFSETGKVDGANVPEVQLKITSSDEQQTAGKVPVRKVTVTLDNADFATNIGVADVKIVDDGGDAVTAAGAARTTYSYTQKAAWSNNAALKAIVEDVLLHDADDYYLANPATVNAANGAQVTGANIVEVGAWIRANATPGVLATAVNTVPDQALVYLNAHKADFNAAPATAYVWQASRDGFVRNDANVGPDFIPLSAIEAAAGVEYVDSLNWAALWADIMGDNVASWPVYTETVTTSATKPGSNSRLSATDVDLVDDNEVEIELTGWFEKGDVISLDLRSVMDKTSRNATVSVDSDDINVTLEDAVYVAIKEEGITATLKKVADVAEEESINLEKDLVIEANVENFVAGQQIELKLSKGFEWDKAYAGVKTDGSTLGDGNAKLYYDEDEDTIVLTVIGNPSKITVGKTEVAVEAVSAKVDDVAKITVKAKDNVTGAFKATADPVEAVKVVGDIVTIEVDEDEDLPVIYSGVNVNNDGITDDSDHVSLKVTMKESVKAALDEKKAFTLTLPEGVYATDVNVSGTKDVNLTVLPDTDAGLEQAFKDAYKKGEQECFEFARKTFSDSAKPFEFDFEMTLIAEPGFEGDVTLTLAGDGFEDAQEVKIAKFVAPYTVEAAQNDLIIDYRNTEVPTDIVIKEAEAGLWDGTGDDALEFIFDIDRMEFEKDATITVDKDSDMEVKALKSYDLGFKVTEESDDEAAVITISDISLYMGRSLAAGAYDLDLWTNAGQWMLTTDKLFTTDKGEKGVGNYYAADFIDADYDNGAFDDQYYTVKEGFVNIVTAGRDQDDASFTTKVIVPVGETKMYSGEKEIALDVPAYINADGYTMLPVRAVAVALGVSNEAVQWDPATKTVIIMYGNRVITMTAGQKVIYATGTAIPARSAVEIKDGRAFLGLRDLATALGVTTVNYDAATKTATLN